MTIKDIARLSGYGISTVSRALNGSSDVSDKTREKILALAKKHNFTPNANAINLKANFNKSISIIVKGAFNIFFSVLIENIQGEIDKIGYKTHVKYISTSESEMQTAKKIISERKPLGIIFLGGNLDNFHREFDEITLPCLLCSTTAEKETYPNLSSVSVDDELCGKRAVEYLFSLGHKNIGILCGDITSFCATQLRFFGAEKAFAEKGTSFDKSNYQYADFTFESAYDGTKKLLNTNKSLTAIYTMSDVMAIGAIRAICDSGKRVPDDISVLGFDGILYARYYNPRITTFEQLVKRIAVRTVAIMREMIEQNARPQHVMMTAKLVEGESVKSIK